MRRLRLYRRLIVLLALVSQVLTGTLVHIPAATAAAAPTAASHEAPPCHEHAPGSAHDGDASALSVGNHVPMPDPASPPFHHCKSGFCTCVCAHAAAALPATEAARPSVPSHHPLLSSAPAPDAPLRVSVFFRPPI